MELWRMSWPQVAKLPRTTPVVIPVAAVEQHGHHLPVCTDSLLLGEICRRVEERCGNRILLAPLLWFGNSHHHLDFPGTLSLSPSTYIGLLKDLAEAFVLHHFCRIIFLNGHGGNIVPSQQAVFELRQKYRHEPELLFLSATYWLLGTHSIQGEGFYQNRMGHACEWETSMVLRLRPEWVGPWEQAEDMPLEEWCEPATRGWVTQERSAPGHLGSPRRASAEKGERLLTLFTGHVVQFLERVAQWEPPRHMPEPRMPAEHSAAPRH